ncbi:MAG: hypothetical protein FH751_03335 [Firmicutes bacterium]|nr:hypothetical protein [Bacillota bacterium]
MEKLANKIIVIVFIVFIFTINIFNILMPDKEFSESENRVLSQFPKFSMEKLTSGRFSNKFETYITDQFIFKDFWVGLKSDIERFSLKNENNGIYFGKDGYLLEDFTNSDEVLANNIKSINYFNKKLPDLTTYFLLAPNSVKIYEDKLPMFSEPYDQSKIIDRVKKNLNGEFIDVYDILKRKKDEYIYFKTDHHWTMRGAYYAYQMFCNNIGLKSFDFNKFDKEIVSNSFYGTFYSKANNRHIPADKIEIFKPKFNTSYKVHYLDEDKYTNTLYEFNHLDKKDKYSLFLDGNHSLITIKTDVKNNKKLVIFKDSYSHSFIPFLANHYKEIHIIDLRYYKLNIYDYIKENDIDEALFLYNVSTFSSDENLSWLRI